MAYKPTNYQKVLLCLEWMLSRISRERGFRTKGVTTERKDGDNRPINKDQKDRIAELARTGRSASIRLVNSDRNPRNIEDGRKRLEKMVEVFCVLRLNKDDVAEGLLMDDIIDHLEQDIIWMLDLDENLDVSWAAVKEKYTFLANEEKPSCHMLKWVGTSRYAPASEDGHVSFMIEHDFDSYRPELTLD